MDQASRRWGCMEMKSEVGVCGEVNVGGEGEGKEYTITRVRGWKWI